MNDIEFKSCSKIQQYSDLLEIYSIILSFYREYYIPSDNVEYNRRLSAHISNEFCNYIYNILKPKYKDETIYLHCGCYTVFENNTDVMLLINNPKVSRYFGSFNFNYGDYEKILSKFLKYNGIVILFNYKIHRLELYKVELNHMPYSALHYALKDEKPIDFSEFGDSILKSDFKFINL